MKPHIRYSTALQQWVCFNGYVRVCADTPVTAYHFWKRQCEDIELQKMLDNQDNGNV